MATTALEDRFVHAVRESHRAYKKYGPRSTQKLRPLHQWVADEIVRELGAEYGTESLRKDNGSEETIAGKYYDKTVDVSISKKGGAPLAIISIKFITSNFKQNANNYFEHLMGETANIRRAGVGFGHLMVLPEKIPYLKRGGQKDHTEEIGDAHLQKYVKLSNDTDHPHRPDVIGIGIVSLHKNPDEIQLADVRKMKLRAEIQSALANELSVPNFFQKMKLLTQAKA